MTVTPKRLSHPTPVQGRQNNYQYHWCSRQELTAGRWVSLIKLPSPKSDDEALLLCEEEEGEDRWRVWIPNHGEAIIDTHSFAC